MIGTHHFPVAGRAVQRAAATSADRCACLSWLARILIWATRNRR